MSEVDATYCDITLKNNAKMSLIFSSYQQISDILNYFPLHLKKTTDAPEVYVIIIIIE